MASFVKFLRGSETAYKRLAVKDNDTLYFIYKNADDTTGSLYLGSKLISGPNGIGATVLSELSDVSINPTLMRDGMILQYNGSTNEGTWNPVSLQTAIENAHVAINPSVSSGEIEPGESKEDAISRLVPDPKEGDIILLDNLSYIYDSSDWKPLSAATNLEDRVEQLEDTLGTPATSETPATGLFAKVGDLEHELEDYYTKAEVDTAIINANHLTYRPVTSLTDIDVNDAANQNTLFLVPITSEPLDDNQYEEYLLVQNKLERIGKFDIALDDYVKTGDSRLLTDEQIDKLNRLVIGEDGTAQVSDCLIKSVDANTFSVNNAGMLSLTNVPANAINLNQYALKSSVGDLSKLVHQSSNLVDEINLLSDILIWHPIEEN